MIMELTQGGFKIGLQLGESDGTFLSFLKTHEAKTMQKMVSYVV